ncbi:MAG: hypothetical protein ACRELB_18220 [Polyangiaceae bacterium]
MAAHLRVLALTIALLGAACSRQAPTPSPAPDGPASLRELRVAVPGAIRVARGLDTLSVSVDPASLADTTVSVDPGMTLGIESHTWVFPVGGAPAGEGRHGYASGADFTSGTDTWSTRAGGIPLSGTKYVAEMQLVLFETDVPAQHHWDPHAGRYKALWTRTLRQAEE